MKRVALALIFLVAGLAPASASAETPSPAWAIQALATPTNFAAGEPLEATKQPRYVVYASNDGGASTDQSPITVTDTLPAGITVKEVVLTPPRGPNIADSGMPPTCQTSVNSGAGVSTVTCRISEPTPPKLEPARLSPGDAIALEILVKVPQNTSGTLTNRVEVEGGGAEPAEGISQNQASDPGAAKAGFEEFKAELTGADGQPVTAAGSHPYQYTTSFGVNVVPTPAGSVASFVPAEGDLKQVEVALPLGLAGNPMAVGRCTTQQFTNHHSVFSPFRENFAGANECPESSVVGLALVEVLEGENFFSLRPMYNLIPPKGMPAQLGFDVNNGPIYINTKIRSEGDYGISGYLQNVTEAKRISAARIMIWGTPWEASHDRVRGLCATSWETCPIEGEGPARPFLRAPSRCGNPLTTTMSFTTWAQPVTGASEPSVSPAMAGCAAPPFTPSIEAKPSTNAADSPAGLHFDLHLPQAENEDPEGLGEADLRDVTVRLPKGLAVNPASADGRESCSPTQVGLKTPVGQESPIHFSSEPASCPDAAKVGTVQAKVPALDHPIKGSVYLAAQEDNPFKSLIALYIVLEDEQTGVVVKQAARVSPDPQTGQLTTTVSEVPQVPFEDFKFDFFEGARAPLRTPIGCGKYTTTSAMTPWSAPEGASTAPTDSFEVSSGPQGPCPSGALDPKLSAGFASTTAATYSPFSIRLTRADGTGEFAGLTTTPPLGFTARLAGIPYCSQAAIDQAVGREHPGGGQQEISAPSCPSASQVGTIETGAGAGPSPFFVSGKFYLAGPYKGAPLSLVAVIPAVAGPFDLGTVVNRVASYVDPETAQIKAVADPLPTILDGIPVDARDLRVNLDRPNFALAPTSCEPKSVGATVTGTSGDQKTVSDRLQVGGCNALKFKPSVSLRLKGGTKRSDFPALKAVVTYPQKGAYANTAKASVALPHSEFLEQSHFRTICTRVQFAANACPKGSIYGKARAYTPLLDQPLEGPVYLRSSSNPLPDVVLDLHGQLNVVSVARVDSHNGGIRSSFESVPDAPLSKVVVELQGGKKGLFVNSRNICNHVNRATAKFVGQNNKSSESRPVLTNANCKTKKKHKGHKKGKGGKR